MIPDGIAVARKPLGVCNDSLFLFTLGVVQGSKTTT